MAIDTAITVYGLDRDLREAPMPTTNVAPGVLSVWFG